MDWGNTEGNKKGENQNMKEQWNLRTQREYKEDNGYWRRVHSAQGVEHGHFRERTMLREGALYRLLYCRMGNNLLYLP